MMRAEHRVAVVGTPNAGKSTLFNALTGLRQRVGNFPGVTVEPMLGVVRAHGESAELIDLPGIYGLEASSEDERLTVDVLTGAHPGIEKPSAILLVIDGSEPEKGLALYAALATLDLPIALAVTMVDTIKARGGRFDDIGLSHELGIPILPVVGTKGVGVGEVVDWILIKHQKPKTENQIWTADSEPYTAHGAQHTAHGAPHTAHRLSSARDIVSRYVQHGERDTVSERLDSVLLHPVWGTVVFVAVMAVFFQSIFTLASPVMDLIESLVGGLQNSVYHAFGAQSIVGSFLAKGLIAGVGSVLVFLPQILILNVAVTVLEECGYLARAAFLVDRVMGIFGLQGRSFIPLLGSFACAIPGIMSARIIPSYRDRMATIMAAPLMTCSARLLVYALIISAVIPPTLLWGVFSIQAVIMAGLFVLGALSGLLVALALKRTLFRGAVVPFLIEFPPYRMPSAKSVWVTLVGRTKDFVVTAGTVILAFMVGLWILTELPRADVSAAATPLQAQQEQLEQSYAASLGKAIQPVFAPLGFDWKLTLGIIGSYAARETFVGVMGQIHAADVSESDRPLREVLAASMPLATGLALLVFYVYALQCVSTMAIMKRETGSWKWPLMAFALNFVMAYAAALLVVRLAVYG
jgi:ferrous iron transport protein B